MSNSVTSIRVALTLVSSNRKTGPMPISVSSRPSCPKDCPFYDNGCYGEYGNTLPHWIKVSDGRRGVSWETFCAKTRKIPYGQTWRHNVVGDLPSEDRVHINRDALTMLVRSQRGCHGFTFTHYSPFIKENAGIIRYANENGFTINLSANNLADADVPKFRRVANSDREHRGPQCLRLIHRILARRRIAVGEEDHR